MPFFTYNECSILGSKCIHACRPMINDQRSPSFLHPFNQGLVPNLDIQEEGLFSHPFPGLMMLKKDELMASGEKTKTSLSWMAALKEQKSYK